MSDSVKYLNKRDAARYLGLSPGTLARLRATGRGPAYSKPIRKIIYQTEDLDAWIAGHRQVRQ